VTSFAAGDPLVSPWMLPGTPSGGQIVTDVRADPVVLRIRRQGAAPASPGPSGGAGGDAGSSSGSGSAQSGGAPGAPGGGGASGGDRRRPKLSLLRVRRSKGRLVASFRLSEAARVATRIDRAKKAKKRVRTRYRTTKRLAVRSLPAGKR
jgi:hypothetical protein